MVAFFKHFSLALVFLSMLISPAAAENIYQLENNEGIVTYSNKPSSANDKPIDLPNITKEKSDARLKEIQAKAPGTCASHGGVDCTKGADEEDGSVICQDGNKDAVLPYRFECLSASIESDVLIKLFGEEETYRLVELNRDSQLLKKLAKGKVEKITLSIRNLSEIDAQGIDVKVVLDEKRSFSAQGPENIAAFGLADFTLNPEALDAVLGINDLASLRADVECTNCRTIKRKR